MTDELKVNQEIVRLSKAFKQLPHEERTVENAMKIFEKFNTNNANSSKDRLDSVDKIDDYFRGVMGLDIRTVSKEYFMDNIGDWVGEFAKYEAPKPKEEPKGKTPIQSVSRATIANISGQLVNHIQPSAGNTAWGDFWGDDDDRARDSFAMFGDDPKTHINEHNIIEVLDNIDLKEFRLSCYFLDDKDETKMVKLVVGLVRDRVALLEKNGIKVDPKVNQALNNIDATSGRKQGNFATNMNIAINLLRDVGVNK